MSHHGAAVGPPEVPLVHPVVEADPLVIAAQTCRYRPDVRPLSGTVGRVDGEVHDGASVNWNWNWSLFHLGGAAEPVNGGTASSWKLCFKVLV